MAHVMLWHM